MAYDESAVIVSKIAGTTLSSGDLYKGAVLNSSGHVVSSEDAGTTSIVLPFGTIYSWTSTTSAAGSQTIAVAVDGIVKLRMAASTLAAGDAVAFSTAGLGIAPTSDARQFGIIATGSSGTTGRIASVLVAHGSS